MRSVTRRDVLNGLSAFLMSSLAKAAATAQTIDVNGRTYRKPLRPTVVICVDGFDPAYLQQGIRDGSLPNLARFGSHGFAATARGVMPTFTNPNNTSILTGTTPAVHGISGNYYLDRRTGKETMITDAGALRSETILGRMSQAGVRAAGITAKDKLREIIGYKLEGIVFSSQHADKATMANSRIDDVEAFVGRKTPDQYDPDLSYFVLDAGAGLIERRGIELLYLSLSDVIQHTHAPGDAEAKAFMAGIDKRIGRLIELGAIVGVTGDHGMNDKSKPDGSPNVVWLEDALDQRFGAGSVRVICPITDPFVRHHGALGSFVRVYVKAGGASAVGAMMEATRKMPGIELVLAGTEAARRFETPIEYEGDFAVVGARNTVIGSAASLHDLSSLAGHRLRSHGGLSEQHMPFLISAPLTPEYAARSRRGDIRNFDMYDYVLNGVRI